MSDPRKRRQYPGARFRPGNGEGQQRNLHNRQKNSHQKGGNYNNASNYNRQTSYDRVRKKLQEEGREARNLVQYNVPLEDDAQKKGRSPPQPMSSRSPARKSRNRSTSASSSTSRDPRKHVSLDESSVRANSQQSRKGDATARHWAFLFENLKRAVDQLYETCESHDSVVECKEVIMMLEQCTKDFKDLIARLILMREYEKAGAAKRPIPLAWDIRKSSPGKSLNSSQTKETLKPSPAVSRSLNFTGHNVGNSWADKVKCKSSPQNPMPLMPANLPLNLETDVSQQIVQEHLIAEKEFFKGDQKPILEEEDTEGWETVQRGGRLKHKSSSRSSLNKDSLSQSNESVHKSRHSSNSSEPFKRTNSKEEPISPASAPERTMLQISEHSRNRTSSRDSEKENVPVPVKETRSLDSGANACSGAPVQSTRNQKKPDLLRQQKPEVPVQSPQTSRSESALHDDLYTPELLDIKSQPPENPLEHEMVSEEKVITHSGSEDELSQEQEEEAALDNALVSAQEEEDILTSQIEEEQAEALKAADEEEQSYLKAIAREECEELEVEEETDSLTNTFTSDVSPHLSVDWETMNRQYEEESEYRSTHSWGDRAETDEDSARTPGKAVHMHEKLSSPSRKRSIIESRKRHEEKQQKAEETRKKMLQQKSDKLRALTKKVEEVRAWKGELLREKKRTMEMKMERAEAKRQSYMKQIVRKAHEEETKANEIAFINTLEAQNKRHDIIVKRQEFEARRQDMQEERQRKHDEKAAKDAAVEERRKMLEAQQEAHLQEIVEKRRLRDSVIEQRQQEKEKERAELARAKEKDREKRIAALNEQQLKREEGIRKSIQQKQDESARRHRENIDQIKEKAFEMSIQKHSTEDQYDAPKLEPYSTKKLCNVCNVLISSEVFLSSHLRGKMHLQALRDNSGNRELSRNDIEKFNLKHLSDAPLNKPDKQGACDKERQKALKKRCKKLRQRMAQRGNEYENALSGKQQTVESEHRAKLQKVVKDLNRFLQTPDKGPWPQAKVSATDRALGDISRIMEKRVAADQHAFRTCGGLTTLSRILLLVMPPSADDRPIIPIIPPKTLGLACNTMRLCCRSSYENCHYMLFSNKVGSLVDALIHQLNILIPENFNLVLTQSHGGTISTLDRLPFDPIASSLMQSAAAVLHCLAKNNPSSNASDASAERMTMSGDSFMNRATDIVSYIVSVGVVDKLSQYFNNVRGPINDNPEAAEVLQHGLGLLIAMAKLVSKRSSNIFDIRMTEDPTQLIVTFTHTELVGIVSLMYGMLLHSGATSRGDVAPPELPMHTQNVTLIGLRLLNNLATLDLKMLQNLLGAEGTSLELRHISAHLIWYCGHWPNEELLHEVILCVGYFTVLNPDNQAIIQSGQPPTVLQQLCQLPFQYFSDARLTNVLFPTLISCCCHCQPNREIVEQELSCQMLANFIEEKELEIQQAKLSPLLTKKSKATEKDTDRMVFGMRFPEEEWAAARKYFKSD